MLTWGANSHGQLGTGNEEDVYEPCIINISDPVTLIAGGGGHSLIAKENIVISCGSNSADQIGRSDDCYLFKPIPFSFGLPVNLVACGWDFSIAVLNDGSVFAWGSNAYGQLGKKSIKSSIAPVRIDIEPVRAISAGLRHVICITISGKPMGWGSNRRKQLSIEKTLETECHCSSTEIFYHPILLNSALGNTHDFTDCAAGAYHSIVKTKRNNLALWGDTRFFQLKSRLQNYSSNTKRESASPIWYDSQVFGGNEIKQLVCGWSHVLVRTSVGEVYSWGRSDLGQLGRSVDIQNISGYSTGEKFSNFDGQPARIVFSSETGHNVVIKSVACGSEHSLAIDSNGQLWVWGWNEHGMCGIGKESSYVEKPTNPEEGITFISQPYLLKLKCFSQNYAAKHIGCGYGHSMAYVEFT